MATVKDSSVKSNRSQEKQEDMFDALADSYDLLLDDWKNYFDEQSNVIDYLLKKYSKKPVNNIYDCTCGIGTQCLGLSMLGYNIKGSDISSKSILRAKQEAEKRGLDIAFNTCDLRKPDGLTGEKFDAVISCDNSLPALLSEEDFMKGLDNIYNCLVPSGIFIASIRNYDQLFAEKKRFNPRQIHEFDGRRTIVFDVWDYEEDAFVVFNVFFLQENESGWDVKCRRMVYRAVYKKDMLKALKQAGFGDVVVVDSVDGKPLGFDFYIAIRSSNAARHNDRL